VYGLNTVGAWHQPGTSLNLEQRTHVATRDRDFDVFAVPNWDAYDSTRGNAPRGGTGTIPVSLSCTRSGFPE